jgi:hypothetical protein
LVNDSINPYEVVPAGQSYATRPKSPVRLIDWISYFLCCLPLLSYGYICVFWLAGSLVRGEWIEPGRPDPKTLFLGIPEFVSVILIVAIFAEFPAIIWLGLVQRKLRIYFTLYAANLGSAVLLFRLNFWNITTWITD